MTSARTRRNYSGRVVRFPETLSSRWMNTGAGYRLNAAARIRKPLNASLAFKNKTRESSKPNEINNFSKSCEIAAASDGRSNQQGKIRRSPKKPS